MAKNKIDDRHKKTTNEENTEIKTITISAAGDCTLGIDEKYPYNNSFDNVFHKLNSDYSYFFKNVKPIFAQDDLTIVNLETTLTTAAGMKKKPYNFKGDPSYVNILKEGSVEVVNVANNHTFDYLEVGFVDTIKHLEAAEIKYFGSDVCHEFNYDYPLITEIKGIKVGLLGYHCWPTVRKKLKENLDYMKENSDLIIVSFHWGKELKNYPDFRQKNLAHYAIDHGADLILGHHPHVIQGIEVYKSKNIVYSLGNFCFGGQINFKDKDTFIYRHTFTFKNTDLLKETNAIIPCSISSIANTNNFQPTPLEGIEKKRVLHRINKYSQKL